MYLFTYYLIDNLKLLKHNLRLIILHHPGLIITPYFPLIYSGQFPFTWEIFFLTENSSNGEISTIYIYI